MARSNPNTPEVNRALRRGRAAPLWLRQTPSPEVHAIVGRFCRLQRTQDLTPGQEWLLEQCLADLAFRRRRARPAWRACSCQYCFSPFSAEDADVAWRETQLPPDQ
jgi:hypothetical protein